MAYLKPPSVVAKVFNPIAKKFGLGLYGTEALTVMTRKTGAEQSIPVIPVDIDGARYIVSTRGESEWVRNVRAAGTVELKSRKGAHRYRVEEVPVAETAELIKTYRAKAGKAVGGYWKKLPDDADHPVFKLTAV